MSFVLAGIFGYVALQLVVGMLVSRRISSEEDYLLAGRSFGFGLATFSFFATWFGAETCIGAAGRIYEHGLSGASADPFGYGVCLLLMGLVFAAPLWRKRLTTLADLFRMRYSQGVERLAVLLMVPTSVLWAAAQVRAFGQVLEASSGIGAPIAITIAAGVAVIYTAAGGMRADVITDLIQGIMIILGLAVLVATIAFTTDAFSTGWSALPAGRLNVFGSQSFFETIEAWAIPICGSVVAQELVARALSTRSPEVARRAALCGGGLYLMTGLVPALLGLLGATMLPGLADPEHLLPALAQKHLAPVLYVLFAGALVSAILSTVDSTLLAASSLTSHNLVIPMRRGITERGKVLISRAGVVFFGVVAWVLALQAESIFSLVESASSFGSAGILAAVVFGLFTRVGRVASAYAALVLGTVIWAVGTLAGWKVVYLFSLAGAFGGYLLASLFERQSAKGAAQPEASPYLE
jgi:solute:Na+ symporter, SSS family